jgi:hypothetical protein
VLVVLGAPVAARAASPEAAWIQEWRTRSSHRRVKQHQLRFERRSIILPQPVSVYPVYPAVLMPYSNHRPVLLYQTHPIYGGTDLRYVRIHTRGY